MAGPARERVCGGHTWPVFRVLLLIAVVAAVWCAAAEASATAPARSPASATDGACPVLKLNAKGRLAPRRVHTYVYRYTRAVQGGRTVFLRRVVPIMRTVMTSCAQQCVRTVRRGGRIHSVYRHGWVRVKVRRGDSIMIVRRWRAIFSFGSCATIPHAESTGVPVSMAMLPGSAIVVDTGVARQPISVSGTLGGFVPGPVPATGDVQILLTHGTLQLAQTPLILDSACNGRQSPSIRTGTPANATLDPTSASTSTLLARGSLTADVHLRVDLPLELRNGDTGCDAPYITTGYSELSQAFSVTGAVGPAGLAAVTLTSQPEQTSIAGCLSPGISTQPCNGFQFPLSFLISAQLQVAITLPGR